METLKYTLKENSPLFVGLKNNPPKWWDILRNDKRFYVEIRKNNEINVYYEGGSIARISYDRKTKDIIAVAHPKYLGEAGKNYVDCRKYIETSLEKMLKNIEDNYSNKKDDNIENISEKKIQGGIIISNRDLFLDSEFQHVVKKINNNNNKFIRIDLIKVVENQIHFVELKHIRDSRLLCKEMNETPEIINQMNKYADFLKENGTRLLEYYKLLYRIKKSLELPVPTIDKNKLSINTKPKLLIRDTYTKITANREKRIKNIESILNNNNIEYKIEAQCK